MRSLVIALCLGVLPLIAAAQLVSNPNPPVAAALAVGGAYTAVATGADALYCNPSGLGYSKGSGGRLAYHQPWSLGFLSHMSATGYSALPRNLGAAAIGVQTLSTREGGHTMAAETEVALSHGFLLQEDIHSSLAFGYTLKLIGYDLGESVANENGVSQNLGSAMTFGLDVGATAQLWDRFRLGGTLKNVNHPQFGSNMKRDLPRILSGGVSYTPYYGVRTSFDVERILTGETQFKGGVSAMVVRPFDLRFGIVTNPNSFTTGFGLRWREMVIDYGFVYHPVLNPSHLIGIGFDMDRSLAQIWQAQ